MVTISVSLFLLQAMILKQFPDYQWLRQQAELAFPDKKGWQGTVLKKEGWPLVVLNTRTKACDRTDIKGPFSVFTNISGSSRVSAGNKKVKVDEFTLFISNREQYYSLEIDSDEPVETFNLHLGGDTWEEYIRSISEKDISLLDDPFDNRGSFSFPNMLLQRNAAADQAIRHLHRLAGITATDMELQEALVPFMSGLVNTREETRRMLHRADASGSGVKKEIFRRISLATDLALSNLQEELKLDDLTGAACLSTFHFIRQFKAVHGLTPHKFITGKRIERSLQLLKKTTMPVADIALAVGFPDHSSYSRAFRRSMHCSPQQYRLEVK